MSFRNKKVIEMNFFSENAVQRYAFFSICRNFLAKNLQKF